jgi:hypothetical protein
VASERAGKFECVQGRLRFPTAAPLPMHHSGNLCHSRAHARTNIAPGVLFEKPATWQQDADLIIAVNDGGVGAYSSPRFQFAHQERVMPLRSSGDGAYPGVDFEARQGSIWNQVGNVNMIVSGTDANGAPSVPVLTASTSTIPSHLPWTRSTRCDMWFPLIRWLEELNATHDQHSQRWFTRYAQAIGG